MRLASLMVLYQAASAFVLVKEIVTVSVGKVPHEQNVNECMCRLCDDFIGSQCVSD